MEIYAKENKGQKIEKETSQKKNPQLNNKLDIENISKIIPETNPKNASRN